MSSQSSTFDPALLSIRNTGATYTATVVYAGTGYAANESFIVRGNMLGGTSPANDLTIVVTTGIAGNLPNAVTSVALSGVATGTVATTVSLEMQNNRTARDASDMTRKLKERIIYNEYRAGTTIAGALKANRLGNILTTTTGGANQLELLQGNAFRLSYLKGKLNCGACVGGPFNTNGPLSFTGGQRVGS
jgi:hypothetical protein